MKWCEAVENFEVRRFTITLFTKYKNYQMRDIGMGRACSAHGRDYTYVKNFCLKI
jgi:hypothetical protein